MISRAVSVEYPFIFSSSFHRAVTCIRPIYEASAPMTVLNSATQLNRSPLIERIE